jgi:type VI protein secretion system component VasF
MGDRRRAANEVYLVCLAFGYRGRFATLDQVQQAAQLAEERQRILREIHPSPMEKLRRLFPEAYTPANSLQVRVPPPPRWWWITSGAAVFLCLVVWLVLWVNAPPDDETIKLVKKAAEAAR